MVTKMTVNFCISPKNVFFKFSNKYFQADIMKKLVYFLKKGSGTESDPFRSDP